MKYPTRDDVYLCVDLLAPEGYGEIIGGSERETDFDKLEAEIKSMGLDIEEYQWYLDLRRYGSVPHSGFWLRPRNAQSHGISGIDYLREAIPFPTND